MEYVVVKRFREMSMSGLVNIKYGSICNSFNEKIFFGINPVCFCSSENAHKYFARNDDGNGLKRGWLTQEIQRRLRKQDNIRQKRWSFVWSDAICQKYRRKDHPDIWLWNHDFYNAPIEDLEHIYSIVKKS